MADPITAAFAAAVSGAGALFSYNKDAFVFEKTLKQAEVHQRQTMRVQEVALYREDIRDLFGLTTQKMDNYLIVNTLMLGFCISLLYGVDLPMGLPEWIIWMWTLSMSGAILFLLLSIWLCLHASITAQSLVVRLLTQWLRLPVPNAEEISRYALDFGSYEKSKGNLFRLPMLGRSKQPLPHVSSSAAIPGGPNAMVMDPSLGIKLQKTHLHLFRQLARSWRGYDAYARVSMIMGSNQLLQALGHLAVARSFMVSQQLFACLFIVITMHSLSLMHFKLNIQLSHTQHTWMMALLGVPPITTFVAASLWYFGHFVAGDVVAIVAIFVHLVWICFVLTLAIEDDGGMPKTFTQVGLATDIVGDDTFTDYIDDQLERIKKEREETGLAGDAKNFEKTMATERPEKDVQATESVFSSTSHHGEDLVLSAVSARLKKLMKQWDHVTEGNLVMTREEETLRKEKILRRFQHLCEYLQRVHLPEEAPAEVKLLAQLQWTAIDGNTMVNPDTGEIKLINFSSEEEGSEQMSSGAVTQRGKDETSGYLNYLNHADKVKQKVEAAGGSTFSESAKLEKFIQSIQEFGSAQKRNSDQLQHATNLSDHTTNETNPLITRAVDHEGSVARLSSQGSLGQHPSVVFDDSQKTNRMLRKASTRPWTSYKQGSGLLVICWLIALIASCLLPFDIRLRPADTTLHHMQHAGQAVESGIHSAVNSAHKATAMSMHNR